MSDMLFDLFRERERKKKMKPNILWTIYDFGWLLGSGFLSSVKTRMSIEFHGFSLFIKFALMHGKHVAQLIFRAFQWFQSNLWCANDKEAQINSRSNNNNNNNKNNINNSNNDSDSRSSGSSNNKDGQKRDWTFAAFFPIFHFGFQL